MGCLQNANVILGSDVIKVLKQFLCVLTNDNIPYVVKEHIIHIIISTLCWVISSVSIS